jgi:hypothetical protein
MYDEKEMFSEISTKAVETTIILKEVFTESIDL